MTTKQLPSNAVNIEVEYKKGVRGIARMGGGGSKHESNACIACQNFGTGGHAHWLNYVCVVNRIAFCIRIRVTEYYGLVSRDYARRLRKFSWGGKQLQCQLFNSVCLEKRRGNCHPCPPGYAPAGWTDVHRLLNYYGDCMVSNHKQPVIMFLFFIFQTLITLYRAQYRQTKIYTGSITLLHIGLASPKEGMLMVIYTCWKCYIIIWYAHV